MSRRSKRLKRFVRKIKIDRKSDLAQFYKRLNTIYIPKIDEIIKSMDLMDRLRDTTSESSIRIMMESEND